MDTTTIIGSIGGLLLIVPFLLNQFNIWSNTDWKYDFVNALASIFLLAYAILLESPIFFVINTIWATVSTKDIITYFLKRGKI